MPKYNNDKSNGELPRVRIPQQDAKPLSVVTDDDGQPDANKRK